MPDCRGVGESRIYSKRAKKRPFAGFVPQSGITAYITKNSVCTLDEREVPLFYFGAQYTNLTVLWHKEERT